MIIDICIAAVPNENRHKYEAIVKRTSQKFKNLGAIKIIECWGKDIPQGEITSMPLAVKKKDDENIVATVMLWESEKIKNEAMNKIRNDQEFKEFFKDMPFDAKRLIYGSFSKIAEF